MTPAEIAVAVPFLIGGMLGLAIGTAWFFGQQSRDIADLDHDLDRLWRHVHGKKPAPDPNPDTAPIVMPTPDDGPDTVEADPLDTAARKQYVQAEKVVGRHRKVNGK